MYIWSVVLERIINKASTGKVTPYIVTIMDMMLHAYILHAILFSWCQDLHYVSSVLSWDSV